MLESQQHLSHSRVEIQTTRDDREVPTSDSMQHRLFPAMPGMFQSVGLNCDRHSQGVGDKMVIQTGICEWRRHVINPTFN